MESQPNVQQKFHRYACPGCGADLAFEPKGGTLTCPYCGRSETIPQSTEQVEERSYEDYLHVQSSQMGTLAPSAIEVKCEGCGATTSFTPPEVAGDCPFCGRTIVAQPRSANPLVAPEGVLPFQVAEDQARESIKKWIDSRWFAPNALKRLAYQQSIGGVYLPYWTYDTHTTTPYRGQRGDYYYETETYTETDSQGKQVTKTRQVRKTRWHYCSGTVSRWFDDVLIPATKSVAINRLNALEPWDLNLIKSYDPAYLAGHKAQRYEVDLAQGFDEAKRVMDPKIQSDIRSDIGGDEQRIDNYKTAYSGITFKHILLPVYIGAYRFREKVYQVMVNARTGEVTGDRPYSFWKIFFFVLAIIAIIVLIAYFTNK